MSFEIKAIPVHNAVVVPAHKMDIQTVCYVSPREKLLCVCLEFTVVDLDITKKHVCKKYVLLVPLIIDQS